MSQLTDTKHQVPRFCFPLLVTLLTILVTGLAAATAGATFPGQNGPVLFRQIDPKTGLGTPLFRVLPDGTEVTVLNRRPGFFSDWRADGNRIAFDFFQPDGDEQIATAVTCA